METRQADRQAGGDQQAAGRQTCTVAVFLSGDTTTLLSEDKSIVSVLFAVPKPMYECPPLLHGQAGRACREKSRREQLPIRQSASTCFT